MTGIERLREHGDKYQERLEGLANDMRAEVHAIADQIERERACDADTIENIRLIVGGVIDDMERHVSGVEGAEDSPVARWARELRRALKSDTSDGRDAQNPSCADPAETAGVTSDTKKVTRDPAEDVSVSAYDLLPEEDADAIAWVRDHGGLDAVKKLLDWVVGHCSTRQQLDFDFWLSGRVMYELGFGEDMADRGEVERRLLARLMPEGMEWLLEVWPKWSNGEYCKFGDWWKSDKYGEPEPKPFRKLSIYTPEQLDEWRQGDGESYGYEWDFMRPSDPKYRPDKLEPPAPEVLDADGAEIREKRDVWWICEGDERGVHAERLRVETICPDGLIECSPYNGGTWVYLEPSELYVNKPVLAADGRTLREGEHVWHVETGREYVVVEPSYGDTVVVRLAKYDDAEGEQYTPDQLTHERPDSWERLEEDAEKDPCGYFGFDGEEICGKCPASGKNCEQTMARDLVRRAKKLAGVSE